jgi:hypothetical protein
MKNKKNIEKYNIINTKNHNIILTVEEKSYISGFLDGDGSLFAQIIKGKDYKYGFTVRFSIVFFQKKQRYWFILWLKNKLCYGFTRIRPDGMSEYTITGLDAVEETLQLFLPYLRLKHETANLILKAIALKRSVSSKEEFLELCRLVDKIGELTDGKKRMINREIVLDFLSSP